MSKIHVIQIKYRDLIQRWRFFDHTHHVLLAVSGGADSMALLCLTEGLPEKTRPQMSVVHYNHGLRGKESDAEEAFVREFCAMKGISFFSALAPVWENKTGLQKKARELRYSFFRDVFLKQQGDVLLTAHQADDQIESFLIRWIQGAGLKGLSGIPLKTEVWGMKTARPLLFFSRQEIREYLRWKGQKYAEDSSNDTDDYLRNRVRKYLRPLVSENPNLYGTHTGNALLLQADAALIEAQVSQVFEEHVSIECDRILVDLVFMKSCLAGLRYRLLQKMWSCFVDGVRPLSGEMILKLEGLLLTETVLEYNLPGNTVFFRDLRQCGFKKNTV